MNKEMLVRAQANQALQPISEKLKVEA